MQRYRSDPSVRQTTRGGRAPGQANPLYCGVASSVIVLNALRLNSNAVPGQKSLEVVVPENLGGGRRPYPGYSQLTLLG